METEIIVVSKCEKITGKEFWGVDLADGRNATVWAANIAEEIKGRMFEKTEAYVKAAGEYLNIRMFNGVVEEKGAKAAPVAAQPVVKALAKAAVHFEAEAPKLEDFQEADGLTINAKSSVKLIKNSKGINWEVKVVAGETELISELTTAAIAQHLILDGTFDNGSS